MFLSPDEEAVVACVSHSELEDKLNERCQHKSLLILILFIRNSQNRQIYRQGK